MPRRGGSNRITRSLAALVGSAALLGAMPALASAACVSGSESETFAQFGDHAEYVAAPGGSFESGAPGWSLNKAAVVPGNESYNLTPGTHSLAIEAGGNAVTPHVCISSKYPSFRFVARQLSGGSNAKLNVSVRWVNLLGLSVNASAGGVGSGEAWQPSSVMVTDESLPLVGGVLGILTLEVSLVFQASGGSFAIDDVYIDPYSR